MEIIALIVVLILLVSFCSIDGDNSPQEGAESRNAKNVEYQKLIDSMPYGVHVMESAAGFYLGTCCFEKVDPSEYGEKEEEWCGFWQPNSRETLYYSTEEEANTSLHLLIVEGIFDLRHLNDGLNSLGLIDQIIEDKVFKDMADKGDEKAHEEWCRRKDPEYIAARVNELGPKHIFAAAQVKKALEYLTERDEFKKSAGQPEASMEETIKEVDKKIEDGSFDPSGDDYPNSLFKDEIGF